jgi:two-component system phosphate regulon sensor histidine kinase PhoR
VSKQRLLWQLYPSYLAITLLSVAAVVAYASWALWQFSLEETAAELQSRALLVVEQFQPLLAAGKFAEADALCKRLWAQTATRLTVILPDGKVVGDSLKSPGRMVNHSDRAEVIAALANGSGASLHRSETLGEKMRYVAVRVQQGDRTLGVVRAAVPLAAIEQAMWRLCLHVAAGSLAVAAILALVSLALSRRITRPLEQLKEGAERFAHGDLSHRLSIADSQEMGALAETLNRMAAELSEKIHAVVRQRNEREAVLSSMVEGVLAVDSAQRLTRFNQAAICLLGIDPQRAEGRLLPEVLRNTELNRLVSAVLTDRAPVEGYIVLHNAKERALHVHGTVLPEVREGETGALLVLHDVTELKKLERVRRDFVANVSHELRTPITSIKGYVETLLDGAMHNPEELQKFLEIVAAQTDRLDAIFEDLLMLARVEQEAERGEIALAPGPVGGVLEAAVRDCQIKAAEKKIRMDLACEAGLEAAMNAQLLEQAVVNLIDNAIKYSAVEQTVRVEAARAGGEVAIRVCDAGCGISSEHLPRLFERFYLVDKARSRKLGGTGLGLAIVKHIAQSHGGRATVESTVGQGSTFTIYLPALPG